jgi:hypothetical protein
MHGSKHFDYCLRNLITNFGSEQPETFNSNDFIGLANYSAVVEKNDDGTTKNILPYFTGISSIYPILSLYKPSSKG